MKVIDATRRFGSVGLLFPLIVIFLAAADSAFACPGHKNGAAHRTKAINTRTVSLMQPTVITYGGAALNRGCVQTRGVRYVAFRNYEPNTRYVAVRNIDYDDDAPRYVAVRNYAPRTKYVAVRNIDYDDDAPRYVAVRNYAPRTKYVAVRNIDYNDDAPRYVAVRNIDYDEDEHRYVTVNYVPRTRQVAVRNIDYDDDVADLDQVEKTSTRHVVVKSDYVAGTEEIVYPNVNSDDTALKAAPIDNEADTMDVAYRDADSVDGTSEGYLTAREMESMYPEAEGVPVTRTISHVPDDGDLDDQTFLEGGGMTDVDSSLDGNGESYLTASDMESMYPEAEAVPVQTSTISYVPESDAFDGDFETDYESILDNGGVVDPAIIENAYLSRVAVNSSPNVMSTDAVNAILDEGEVVDPAVIENAYLSSVATDTSPNVVSTSAVSYIPADDIDDSDSIIGIDPMYAEGDDAAQSIQYVLVNDDTVVDADTTYVAPIDVDHDELGTDTISYIPADDVEDMDAENVVYVPVDDLDVQTVSYVPVDSVDARYVVDDDCPTSLSDVDADPSYDSYY